MTAVPLYSGPALRVSQPIGHFWAASIPAQTLLEVTAADRLRLLSRPTPDVPALDWAMAGELEGTQRKLEAVRLKEIAAFIKTIEATFPNSVILSVDDASATEEAGRPWVIQETPAGRWTLTIPQGAQRARVVDGQHRLYAFSGVDPDVARDFELLCAVFVGLPDPIQAFVFATINTNQKPVRRGLAMNLYGYNVEDQERSEWNPEKLAVFMARRLNFEEDSPLFQRVKVEAEGAPEPSLLPGAKRPIPMAAVVDVPLGLVSRHPKRDRDELATRTALLTRRKRKTLSREDAAPLRHWYVDERDADTYALLKAYFQAISEDFWSGERATLMRAVDIRALGDFLGVLLGRNRPAKLSDALNLVEDTRKTAFVEARRIRFDDSFFEATYRGRRRVENTLRLVAGENIWAQLSPADRPEYERVLGQASPGGA